MCPPHGITEDNFFTLRILWLACVYFPFFLFCPDSLEFLTLNVLPPVVSDCFTVPLLGAEEEEEEEGEGYGD